MMAVQRSTSCFLSTNSVITLSSFPSGICPWATAIFACGTSFVR